ncbi:Protein disulfide isomerase-like 5-4 [Camellia lanceoleosa]|uniref:Protein disulfide isomerase-like 5-4 n=1 Tax=Camellia lanceoleosa TaxID=1840588 RepID=A0ACC0H6Q1_9ERIC|nr:Protein disulfide isomerase-like 5-4 [Camellia lanceoleosa]
MVSTHKLKSVDFYRKIPRDLTEASLPGAGLSIIAAFSMIFLFGMELNNYFTVSTSTSVIVDKDFPALSCEFAAVDVSDILGTSRLNITKTIHKYPIDPDLKPTGFEFHTGLISRMIKHDDEVDEEYAEGSFVLSEHNFDRVARRHPILVVNFYAPWCHWSNRLKPSWEKAVGIIRERYDPDVDGHILLGKVDCTEEINLCRRHHIQGYPSIRIFRKGSDARDDHGHHDHESYYGDRDTDSLVKTMEDLVAPITMESQRLALKNELGNVADDAKRPAPLAGGCRIEGFVRVKKVPGNLVISARSVAHSFDASKMNMSHIISNLSFGKKISPEVMSGLKRVVPYLGGSHDKLNGQEYITHLGDSKANITVLITEDSKSFSHFITSVCAIIGGVFTVAGILDSVLHNTMRLLKKVELGKNF